MTWSSILTSLLSSPNDEGGSSNSNKERAPRSSSIIAGRRSGRRASTESNSDEVNAEPNEKTKTPTRRRRRTVSASGKSQDEMTQAETKASKPTRKRSVKTTAKEANSNDSLSAEISDKKPVVKPQRRRVRSTENVSETNVDTADLSADSAIDSDPVASSSTLVRKDRAKAAGDIDALNERIADQNNILNELRAGLLALGQQLDRTAQKPRLGVFVDVPNIMYGQESDEKPINMGKLLDLLRSGRDIVRATAYSPISDNPAEPLEGQKFVAPFVPYEYRIVTKPLKRFADGSIKGNFDVEMAIDMLTMADRLDVIAIVSGDADFARAVEVVQTRGVRVEVVAFAGSSSLEMRSLADQYIELGSVIDQVT